MRCPSCDFDLGSTPPGGSCPGCGLYVGSSGAAGTAPSGLPSGAAIAGGRRSAPPLFLIAVGLAIVGGGVLVFLPSSEPPSASLADAATAQPEQPPLPGPGGAPVARRGEGARTGNPIERASQSTVAVKTAWGVGSGFIADSACRVVTNRRVIEVDEQALSRRLAEVEAGEEVLLEARQRLAEKGRAFERRCRDCSEEAFDEFLGEDLESVGLLEQAVNERRDELLELTANEGVVVFGDGSRHRFQIERTSESWDLALLRVDSEDCSPLEGFPNELTPGQRLYSIGRSPGASATVTSGVFSGYDSPAGDRMIQTDAAINSSNTGGPLVDADGRVVGVNTSLREAARGIGFAIPLEIVHQEFSEL